MTGSEQPRQFTDAEQEANLLQVLRIPRRWHKASAGNTLDRLIKKGLASVIGTDDDTFIYSLSTKGLARIQYQGGGSGENS